MPAQTIRQLLERTAHVCKEQSVQLVLAESCTAGMIAALLAQTPGASSWLCGSSVVYQVATKQAWLNIDRHLLQHYSPESPQSSQALCRAVLEQTPHANCGLAITGRLGPSDRPLEDGVAYLACAWKGLSTLRTVQLDEGPHSSDILAPPANFPELRVWRQKQCVHAALGLLLECLDKS